jgi:hypothetical protein
MVYAEIDSLAALREKIFGVQTVSGEFGLQALIVSARRRCREI